MISHWTELEYEMLKDIKSFEDMIPVALSILKRMQLVDRHIVQICGPISTGGKGSLEENVKYFKKAQNIAIQKGLNVFDQIPFTDSIIRLVNEMNVSKGDYCFDILHKFYRGVFASKMITEFIFLPKWQESTGAKWEHEEASLHGISVKDYPIDWLEEIDE